MFQFGIKEEEPVIEEPVVEEKVVLLSDEEVMRRLFNAHPLEKPKSFEQLKSIIDDIFKE